MSPNKKKYIEPRCIEIANYLEKKKSMFSAREIEVGINSIWSPPEGEQAERIQKELNERIQNEVIPCLEELEKMGIIFSTQHSPATEKKYGFVR